MGLKSFLGKNKKKIAIGAGALLGAGALAIGAKKLLGGRGIRTGRRRTGSLARLRSRVQKLALKIKERQYKRKLFKEDMRI